MVAKSSSKFRKMAAVAKSHRPGMAKVVELTLDHLKLSGLNVYEPGQRETTVRKARGLIFMVCQYFFFTESEIGYHFSISVGTVRNTLATVEGNREMSDSAALIAGKVLACSRDFLSFKTKIEIGMEYLGVYGDQAFPLYLEIMDRIANMPITTNRKDTA